DRARVHLELGTLYARLGEHRLGEESLREAERLHPEVAAGALTQLGLAAFRDRRPEEARELYRRSLELHPDASTEAETWRYLGILASTEGRFAEALRRHRRALLLYRQLKHPLGQAKVYNSIGQTCL